MTIIVNRSTEVFHVGENRIVLDLERYYNLSAYAENMVRTLKNKHVVAAADTLIKAIQDSYFENASSI